MSRIFDAIKRAQGAKGSRAEAVPAEGERRRSPRRKAHVPVFVYGHNPAQQPFHEEAYSAVISELGGLLIMSAAVLPGQTLLLTNKITQQERECRVAYVTDRDPQRLEVAVEVPHQSPEFWRLTAPPRSAASLQDAGKRQQG